VVRDVDAARHDLLVRPDSLNRRLDPALMRKPRVQQYSVRVCLLWAANMLTNAAAVFWLFLSPSLKESLHGHDALLGGGPSTQQAT
jgi:hypothetical protein